MAKPGNDGRTKKSPRRRRIFNRTKPSSSSAAAFDRGRGGSRGGGGGLSNGVFHGVARWFITLLGLGGGRKGSHAIEGGGAGGEELFQLSGTTATIALVLIFGLAVAVFLPRFKRASNRGQAERPGQVTRCDGNTSEREQPRPASDRINGQDRREANESRESGDPSRQLHPLHSPTINSGSSQPHGGERRISLYDVLTGDAPIPPQAGTRTTPGAGSGFAPGGSRRASIFDRIADVVFNEEQKKEDPVDADAVRAELEDEFTVTLKEGAMGMTLSMEPGSRNAVVGKLVPHGQAYRAGVQTRDLVIGVGEHRASSYGTVLAFMNIMGRPIELRFRKFSSQIAVEGGSRSGGEAIVTSGTAGGFASALTTLKRSTKNGGASRIESPDSLRDDTSSSKKSKAALAPTVPSSPISPRKPNKIAALGQEVASSDSGFSYKMEHGVVVTKYGKKGAAAQKVLFLDGSSMALGWRDLDSRSPGHLRSKSFTNLMKGQREPLALSHLVEVVAGDEPDPRRPSEQGSALLREHCDETLLGRSFALQFKERSLEMTCDSRAEMRQLVDGFRDLQRRYGS